MGKIATKIPRWNGMHTACVPTNSPAPLAGQAFTNGVAVVWQRPLGGLTNWRLHIKTLTGGGMLSARYLRAGYNDAYLEAGNPGNVTVTAGTATKMDVTQHFGEYAVEFTFTPSGDGTFAYVDICGVAPALT